MFSSWQTTIGGVIAAIGTLAAGFSSFEEVGAALTALGIAIIGLRARDNGVSSEQAKAK